MKHASTVLKHLQPYREKLSKDRGKRFHYGSLYGDAEKPENHDIELFEFWAIKPTSKVLCRAHFFFIGQIIGMMDSEKSCNSNLSSNKNLQIMFEIFKYDFTTMLYTSEGRTGLLHGCKMLNCRIRTTDSFRNEAGIVMFDYKQVVELGDYLPYHDDADIDQRIEELNSAVECADDDEDPYIVDKVLQKRFHPQRNQYEFLVSWVGYSDNTWEVAENVPLEKISEYEVAINQKTLRSGRVMKPTMKKDYVQTF